MRLKLILAPLLLSATFQSNAQVPIQETTPMSVGRLMHGATVLGDYLYVFGGVTDIEGWSNSVEKARILPDGNLSKWVPDRPMPQVRAYISNSTVALNDVVYVIGGSTKDGAGREKFKTAIYAKPSAEDGTLSEWIESTPFPGPAINCFTVSTSPGFLHVIGGRTDNQEIVSEVITGVIGADGSILAWEPAPPIPTPLWFHHSATAGSRVWVWGGLEDQTSKSVTGRVFSAPITGNGRLGNWEESPTQIPVGIYRGANAVAGPYLMSFCPSYEGNIPSADVVFSASNGNSLIPWQRISTPISVNKYVTCTPDYRRNRIFIPGGRLEYKGTDGETVKQNMNNVYYFQLTGEAQQAAVGTQTAGADIQSSRSQNSDNELTYLTQEDLPEGALPGFLPYEAARRTMLRSTKPLIVYFNLNNSKPSQEQINLLRYDPALQGLTEEAIFAWVDVQQSPQVAQALGVYRAPTWILYNNRGIEQGRTSQPLTGGQLRAGLDAM